MPGKPKVCQLDLNVCVCVIRVRHSKQVDMMTTNDHTCNRSHANIMLQATYSYNYIHRTNSIMHSHQVETILYWNHTDFHIRKVSVSFPKVPTGLPTTYDINGNKLPLKTMMQCDKNS